MDIFCEYIIKRKKSAKEYAEIFGCIFGAIILSGAAFFATAAFGSQLLTIAILIIAAIWYGAVKLIQRTDIEFEYIVTNSVLDIDKIMSKKSRKRILSIDFKEIDICAPIEKEENNNNAKIIDATRGERDEATYFADFSKNGQKTRLYFQPNKKVIKALKKSSPSLVSIRPEDMED